MSSAGGWCGTAACVRSAVTSKFTEEGDFKNIPPIETMIPGFDLIGWQGFMAPKNTPRDTVMRLNAAFNEVLKDNDVRRFYASNNLLTAGGTPEDFGARIQRDLAFYGRVAKDAGIVPQ